MIEVINKIIEVIIKMIEVIIKMIGINNWCWTLLLLQSIQSNVNWINHLTDWDNDLPQTVKMITTIEPFLLSVTL